MSIKKIRKNYWERAFSYPSFNTRFGTTLGSLLGIFIAITIFLIFGTSIANNASEKIALLNLVVQSATLILGTFAAYYALRQLVETRFNGLDNSGMEELKRAHYSRAFEKWREAFYIKPDPMVFMNMCEALLLIGDYDYFDQYTDKNFIKRDIVQESSDKILLLFLIAVRHLLVKNQGEAEKHISAVVKMVSEYSLRGVNWDFLDIQRVESYQNLIGECRNILDNLIAYLSGTLQSVRKKDFEAGIFSSQSVEPETGLAPVVTA